MLYIHISRFKEGRGIARVCPQMDVGIELEELKYIKYRIDNDSNFEITAPKTTCDIFLFKAITYSRQGSIH